MRATTRWFSAFFVIMVFTGLFAVITSLVAGLLPPVFVVVGLLVFLLLKRKKWSDLEEQTLLSKYSDLLNSDTLAKLKNREKKFRPITDHVNSLHHLHDLSAFLFKWSRRDVSNKVQNMRHQ